MRSSFSLSCFLFFLSFFYLLITVWFYFQSMWILNFILPWFIVRPFFFLLWHLKFLQIINILNSCFYNSHIILHLFFSSKYLMLHFVQFFKISKFFCFFLQQVGITFLYHILFNSEICFGFFCFLTRNCAFSSFLQIYHSTNDSFCF